MSMKVSDRGRVELAGHEGIVPAPYLDSVGVWTYGVGHTSGAGEPYPKNMPKGMPKNVDKAIAHAMSLFASDLQKYEDRVNRAIEVPLKQHEFDALVSFDYNTGGIFRAKLTEAINAGDPNAYSKFMGWTKPASIIPRREKEMELFHKGVYSVRDVPIWGVNSSGRLTGVTGTISADRVLQLMGKSESSGLFEAIIELIASIFRRKP
tara:strand:- start:4201 stop:4821 length:621 start_codon:yes stop_codon:yes gene_type:complete